MTPTPTVAESADLRRASHEVAKQIHEVAKQIHEGQTYGRDYYTCHLLPVVAELQRAYRDPLPADFEAAAVLHDCLEQDVPHPLPGDDVKSRARALREVLCDRGARGPLKELTVDAVVLLTGTGRRRADRNLAYAPGPRAEPPESLRVWLDRIKSCTVWDDVLVPDQDLERLWICLASCDLVEAS